MLIISKFRDYYDASVGYGIDKTIVYERETRIVKSQQFYLDNLIEGTDFIRNFYWLHKAKRYLHRWRIIGFCGKTYVLLIEKEEVSNEGAENDLAEYFYGDDALERVFVNKKDKWWFKQTKNFIDKWHNREFTDFFVENKIPIFIVEPEKSYAKQLLNVTVNPSLNEFKFFRIFDSYSAFQEIQMFISGVIGTGFNKTLEIDNKEKIKQYGFDPQWSFRNPDPPKRKQ